MNENENIIDAIEQRLKVLEREKDQIELIYGIDENILSNIESLEQGKLSNLKKFILDPKNKKSKVINNYGTPSLPKLEPSKKKEIKSFYKTPDYLKDSLRYEPSINDLWSEKDFEPSFANLNSLKTNPSIPKGNSISNYIDWVNKDYFENYMN